MAEHTARKLVELGVKVRTLSDRSGYIHKHVGLNQEDIDVVMKIKKQGKVLDELELTGTEYQSGKPWQTVSADMYFPCATQN